MSTDVVAVTGFVTLFTLMLLRVPVGMAMGLVGVTGFGFLVGGAPALKLVGQTSMLFDKVVGTYRDHVLTYDLNLPTWPFFAVAWAGDVSAVLLIAIRTYRLIFQPQTFARERYLKPVE